jgi:hypothetical protein
VLQRPSSTPSYPFHPTWIFRVLQVFARSYSQKASAIKRKIAMSIARDDMGNIREMHAAAGLPHNFRDASGGTDGTQVYVNLYSAIS